MPSRRFPLLWLQRYGHTNAVRVFGALLAVVVVVILAGAGVAVGVRGLACGNRERTNSVAPLPTALVGRRGR